MERILAIDYGQKRTGIAVTDPLQMIASALETVPTAQLMDWLRQYMSREPVERIIVGEPVHLNGNVSDTMTQFVTPFVNRLRKSFPDKEVILVDERFTSKLAAMAMLEGGMKKKERQEKANLDKLSATILLQGYLETLKR
ncbi:MAG: Holliday junction resolvase RuvX [Bacteroidales bacterium]|jgi:putative Holliday junction resolvase|nr:Holliday junction resolvase RuvX [Bacteroidales bacterium]